MTTTYTTYGHVRGCCGHRHRSFEAAEACRNRDVRGCASLSGGAYSDRIVAVIRAGRLYHDEAATDPVWPSHGRSTGAARFR